MKKLHFFWKELIATFWFLPVLIICFAVFLSIGLVSLDDTLSIDHEGWARFFLVNSADSARSILSTISGAMIGVAGTVFSVTLVALTLASSQFGPRLIKNFMYIKLNQIVLGAYVSTYLYCLLVLNAIKESNGYHFIPAVSILVAIFAAMINIILLIVFIHQIAVSIQADKVIADISTLIAKQLKTLFPEKMGDEIGDTVNIDASVAVAAYQTSIPLKSHKIGYLQYVDSKALIEMLAKHNSLLALHQRPGSFLVHGGVLGVLYANSGWDEAALKKLLDQFVIGKTKTAQQNLEYSIDQMVEIAARALSPGTNDPFTAMACIDNLAAAMCYLAETKFPSKFRLDDEGKLRVIADTIDFEGLLDGAFNQIRQFSAGIPAVLIKLMEALATLQNFTGTESTQKAVRKHAEMVLALGKETIKEKNDIQDLTNRAKNILELNRNEWK